ncbi:MAG: hypothetical protein ACREPU_12205 [Rhodanobacteraceae bacterium]
MDTGIIIDGACHRVRLFKGPAQAGPFLLCAWRDVFDRTPAPDQVRGTLCSGVTGLSGRRDFRHADRGRHPLVMAAFVMPAKAGIQ